MPAADLARSLLDTPRWVETREMLRSGEAHIFGLAPDRRRFVASCRGLVVVVGRPESAFIQEGAAAEPLRRVELLCAEEDAAHVAAALPLWMHVGADIHAWPGGLPLPEAQQGVRIVERAEVAQLAVPAELRDEMLDGSDDGPLVAALDEDRPVAFCYPSAVSETLWDVSIDTLEEYRRRGYAARAFRHLAHLMGRRGKWPVWGSADDNEPSRRLALKLGFEPAERLALFTAPRATPGQP